MNSTWHEVAYRVDAGGNSNGSGIQNNGDDGPAGALRNLLDERAAVIVLKGLLKPVEYRSVADEVARRRAEASVTRYHNGALTTFGTYLARHISAPECYFADASSGDVLFPNPAADLRATVRRRLRDALGLRSLEVAAEPHGRGYAPAIVRLHQDGVGNPLHNDNVMRDASGTGLSLAHLRYQFSCVTCLQECDSGGELLHYRRRWSPADEVFKVPQGLGYDQGVVEGAELCRFRPETGDVYIMDPTHYHAIDPVCGRDRLTMGFFFGFFDEAVDAGVCWS